MQINIVQQVNKNFLTSCIAFTHFMPTSSVRAVSSIVCLRELSLNVKEPEKIIIISLYTYIHTYIVILINTHHHWPCSLSSPVLGCSFSLSAWATTEHKLQEDKYFIYSMQTSCMYTFTWQLVYTFMIQANELMDKTTVRCCNSCVFNNITSWDEWIQPTLV